MRLSFAYTSRLMFICSVILSFSISCTQKFRVLQKKGIDQDVNYESLLKIGPWDDRNYQLTKSDLQFLSPNEEEIIVPIPAFYRVQLRKEYPDIAESGAFVYPFNALPFFLHEYKGFLVNGEFYRQVDYKDGQYRIIFNDNHEYEGYFPDSNIVYNIIEQVRVSPELNRSAQESAIKVNPVDPNFIIAGSNGPYVGQNMHFSADGGKSWTRKTLFGASNSCCDPTVEWSSDGLFAYTATLGNSGFSGMAVWFYRSGDLGQTWNDLSGSPRRRELSNSFNDKPYLHVDKHLNSPHVDNVYIGWTKLNGPSHGICQFAKSTDRGNSWEPAIPFSSDPIGVACDITTDSDGNVYYFYNAFEEQKILLKKSVDGGDYFLGNSFEVSSTNGNPALELSIPIPSQETKFAKMTLSADSDLSNSIYKGSIYVTWTDSYNFVDSNPNNNHSYVRVAYSRDQGSTWTVVTPHETDDWELVDRWHSSLVVGSDGTVHVTFYDTRNSVNRTGIDLYYSYSENGGQSFSTLQRLTSVTSQNVSDGNEFGDYNGIDVLEDGIISIYTDNRPGGSNLPEIYVAFGKPFPSPCINVDFNYSGLEDGSISMPYNTLAEAVLVAPWGGRICLSAGSSTENIIISKRLILQSNGGLSIIGRQ